MGQAANSVFIEWSEIETDIRYHVICQHCGTEIADGPGKATLTSIRQIYLVHRSAAGEA
jgi:hypothetical protein